MTTAWEQFEQLMRAEMRKVYSETAVDHALNPRNLGNLDNADSFAAVTGPCGDTMEIWLRVDRGSITQSTFITNGCGSTIMAGSMTTELATGKTIGDAAKISQQDILAALGGLPEESQHCALLAANTLKEAITNYISSKREPWDRAYKN